MYGKSACPVLRGAGVQLEYGRDIVAPSRKQTANGEHKHRPVAPGDSCLLEERASLLQTWHYFSLARASASFSPISTSAARTCMRFSVTSIPSLL